jgi:hypothetical protein
MGIEVKWDDEEKTIIRHTYSGQFTWDELEAVNHELKAMLDSVDHRVDFIGDIENVKIPRDALSNYPKMASSPVFTHPNAGLAVMLGTSRFAETMLGLFGKVFYQTSRIVTASTPEEAYEIIAAHRQARDRSA